MKYVAAFTAGLGIAVLIAFGFRTPRARRLATRSRDLARRFRRPDVDLNTASLEQLLGLGLERPIASRIIEARPYRSKLELVSRVMLPNAVYSSIRYRVTASGAQDAVKVAS